MNRLTALFLLLTLVSGPSGLAQRYFNSWEVLHRTQYNRKKQVVHEVHSAYLEEGHMIINLTASFDSSRAPVPCHVRLPVDTILTYYKNDSYFYHPFDSALTVLSGVKSLERRYNNITNRRKAFGLDINCYREVLLPGFRLSDTASPDTVAIVRRDDELFEVDKSRHIYLKGEHIVLLYYLPQPRLLDGEQIDYLVINVENSPGVNWLPYLKLPYTVVLDTLLLPFTFLPGCR